MYLVVDTRGEVWAANPVQSVATTIAKTVAYMEAIDLWVMLDGAVVVYVPSHV
jgi:hypothetical protein